ncbi:MAG: methyltransferase domain-containing protein [Candidatus Marinimicrobia bacterium]|nr:methyltransferase domain-containing protein [Candidatus Neomarinimicrobiota bacterium]
MKFFNEQYWYAETVLSFYLPQENFENLNLLEVGSAEGGGLKYFSGKKAFCYGIELAANRHKFAMQRIASPGIQLINGDICDRQLMDSLPKMDIIVIRDVIEHIPDKITALRNMRDLLKDNGTIFLSFPPKYSPYAGHQQNVKKVIGKLPFIHLLPTNLYRMFLKIAGESENRIKHHIGTRSTMISIYSIEKLFSKLKLSVLKRDLYFIRPCFKKRFGLKPRKIFLNKVPILNEIFSLGALYILKKRTE